MCTAIHTTYPRALLANNFFPGDPILSWDIDHSLQGLLSPMYPLLKSSPHQLNGSGSSQNLLTYEDTKLVSIGITSAYIQPMNTSVAH